MKREARLSFLIVLWSFICLPLVCPAQKAIKGKVVDQKSQPVQNAKVSVDGSQYVYTSASGEFSVSNITTDGPKFINANKEGMMLQDWRYDGKEVKIVMTPPTQIRGRVLSDKQVPLPGVNVLIIGVRGLAPVKTDAQGFFSFNVPEGVEVDTTDFKVFDPRLKSSHNYIVRKKDGLFYVLLDVPPRKVFRVKIVDPSNQPVADARVYVDNKPYTTNENGEFSTGGEAYDFSQYAVEGYNVTNLNYTGINMMLISVREPLSQDEPLDQGPVTIIDDQREAIFSEVRFVEKRLGENTREREEIRKILEGDEPISPEERKRLVARLKQLEEEFTKYQKDLDIAKEKALSLILVLQRDVLQERQATQEVKDSLQLAKKNASLLAEIAKRKEDIANRNLLIFILVGSAAVAIAAILYINNRRVRQQKDQLAEKNEMLDEKNQMLDDKNQMLEQSAIIMDQKNRQIESKNNQLKTQNEKITDSIRYAFTIQQSILPSIEQISENFAEMFIFYAPKDIVSGDFYWHTQKEDDIVITAADCTGHGVPGAFMTVMGNSLLNNIVNEDNILDPAEILTVLNDRVKATLKTNNQEKEGNRRDGDGMDMALLRINLREKKAVFAGAKNPLYYVRDGEIFYIKGSNISIGSTLRNKNKEFKNKYIDLQGGESFYLVSDGFQDQLGGNHDSEQKRKKYMKTRFIELIQHSSQYPMDQQEEIFSQEFNQWKGEHDQTDDVVVLGLKIPDLI